MSLGCFRFQMWRRSTAPPWPGSLPAQQRPRDAHRLPGVHRWSSGIRLSQAEQTPVYLILYSSEHRVTVKFRCRVSHSPAGLGADPGPPLGDPPLTSHQETLLRL